VILLPQPPDCWDYYATTEPASLVNSNKDLKSKNVTRREHFLNSFYESSNNLITKLDNNSTRKKNTSQIAHEYKQKNPQPNTSK
jgi:hypothetical protein